MTDKNNAVSADAYEEGKDEITFRIVDHIGILRTNATGWTRELNYVSWCDRPAKYDIREWTPDHTKGTRGITLTEYEMSKICEWMSKRNGASEAKDGKEV